MDDDGFESLNGNGSSENGDEPVDEDIEPLSGPNIADLNKNSNKYSDIFLKCPDKCNVDDEMKQDVDNIQSTLSNTCCETVKCDDNVPNIDLFQPCKDKKSNFRLIDVHKGDGNTDPKSLYDTDFDQGNKDDKISKEWINSEGVKVARVESNGGWSSEEVDHIMNRNHIIQRRQSAPLPHTCRAGQDTDSDGSSNINVSNGGCCFCFSSTCAT